MKKRVLSIICASLLLISIIPTSFATSIETEYQEYEAVTYPVNAESPEWKTFQTHEEMVAATRIPKERYANATTEDLLISALEYPLFIDIFAYSSIEEGLENVREDCTALDLFLQQEDAALVLSNYMSTELYSDVATNVEISQDDSWKNLLVRTLNTYFEETNTA